MTKFICVLCGREQDDDHTAAFGAEETQVCQICWDELNWS